MFTSKEIELIHNATFKDILLRVTNLEDDDLQDDVFTNNNPKQSDTVQRNYKGCPTYVVSSAPGSDDVDACSPMETFDYFTGSEAPYIVTFSAVALYIILLIVLLILIAKQRQRITRTMMSKAKPTASASRRKTKRQTRRGMMTDLMPQEIDPMVDLCTEVVEEGEERDVSIYVTTEPKVELTIATSDTGRRLRVIPLDEEHPLEVWIASNDPYLLVIRISNGYDVIVRFDNEVDREKFAHAFPSVLQPVHVGVTSLTQYPKAYIMREAITKKKRQLLVEDFMKEVFARATQPSRNVAMESGGRPRSATRANELGTQIGTNKVLTFELSKEEFADSMGLKPNSLFVEQMFRIADKDNSGFITFREMLDLLVIFNKGSVDDKLKLMFDLYDIDNSGTLEKQEFLKMTKTMLEMTHTSMAADQLADFTDKLFESRGLGAKAELTFEDFKALVGNDQETVGALKESAAVGSRPRTMTLVGTAKQTVAEAYGTGKGVEEETRQSVEAYAKDVGDVPDSWMRQQWILVVRYVQNYKLQMFWTLLFHLSTILIFVERAYCK